MATMTACVQCERVADQRDAALKRAAAAVEEAQTCRAKYAEADRIAEDALADREVLLGENAELRARVEDLERRAARVPFKRRRGLSRSRIP